MAAEALGVTSSIIAITDLAGKIGIQCFKYWEAVKDARSDIDRLQARLTDLTGIIQRINELSSDPNNKKALETSRKLSESLKGCEAQLEDLLARLGDGTSQRMRRFGIRSLKWPFQRQEMNGILTHLERSEKSISSALLVDNTALLIRISEGVDSLNLGQASTSKDQACFMIPFAQDPHFIDRPDITKWFTQKYQESWSRLALVGMGGFGKSQLAIRFAYMIQELAPQTNIFWVNAATDTSFEQSYRSIADRLNLPGRNDTQVDILKLVYDRLQRDDSGPCMMILDNADDATLFSPNNEFRVSSNTEAESQEGKSACGPSRNLALLLPKRSQSLVLVTTRSTIAAQRLTESHHAIFDVSTMEAAEAFQMLKTQLVKVFDEDEGKQLVQALGYIPLAIDQATAYINQPAAFTSVKAYLEDFRASDEKKESLLNQDNGDLRRNPGVSNSVVITWQVTFDQIRKVSPSAADLLTYVSCFQPQNIPIFALGGYQCSHGSSCKTSSLQQVKKPSITNLGGCFDYARFQQDLGLLMSYSLISITTEHDFCDVHPLVQFCTQTWSATFGDRDTWKQNHLRKMSELFHLGVEQDDYSAYQVLCPHIEPLIRPVGEGDVSSWSGLVESYVWCQWRTGNARNCQSLMEGIIDAYATRQDSNEYVLDLLRVSRFQLILHKGDLRELEFGQKLMQALRKRRKTERNVDLMWLITVALSSCLFQAGRYEEAANAWTEFLDEARQFFGPEDTRMIQAKLDMVKIYFALGLDKLEEAEKLVTNCLKLTTNTWGENHLITLDAESKLAECYLKQKEFKKAEQVCSRLLALDPIVFPYTNVDRTACVDILCKCYMAQDQWEKAELIVSQTMDKLKTIQGGWSFESTTMALNLARIWIKLERLRDARELLVEVLVHLRGMIHESHTNIKEAQKLLDWIENRPRKRAEAATRKGSKKRKRPRRTRRAT